MTLTTFSVVACLLTFSLASCCPSVSKHPILIVISFDGFRHDFQSKTYTPNLDYVASNGVSSGYLRPRFTTKTFPNHHSLATGMNPENHGVVDNFLWDSLYDEVLDGKDDTDHRFWNYDPSILPLWTLNTLAADGRASGAVMWPGSNHPYSGILPSYLINYTSATPVETSFNQIINWIKNPTNPANLVHMYVGKPDGDAHEYGPESAQVIRSIQEVDGHVGSLIDKLKAAGLWGSVNLVLLSDHGFATVRKGTIINLDAIVSPSLYYVNGWSPVRHINPKAGKYDAVYNALKTAASANHFRVFKRADLPAGWHYKNSRRTGSIVVVADVGYAFNDMDYEFKTDPNRSIGLHGYDNEEASMRGFFMGIGPVFKTGYKINWVRNVDTFPLFCKIIDLPCPPTNGTIQYVQELLV